MLSSINIYQKLSGVSFVLAKISNIFAVPFIFLILKDSETYKPLAFGMLATSGVLLLTCIGLAIKGRVDD
jgi:hypothetical protein